MVFRTCEKPDTRCYYGRLRYAHSTERQDKLWLHTKIKLSFTYQTERGSQMRSGCPERPIVYNSKGNTTNQQHIQQSEGGVMEEMVLPGNRPGKISRGGPFRIWIVWGTSFTHHVDNIYERHGRAGQRRPRVGVARCGKALKIRSGIETWRARKITTILLIPTSCSPKNRKTELQPSDWYV